MAGSASTLTSRSKVALGPYSNKYVDKLVIDWTADDTDGSVPKLTLNNLSGFIIKVETNPGSTAPTDNYDITLEGASDTTIDHFAGALANRDTANTECAYPTASGAAWPCWLEKGSYKLAWAGNSVNSATGQVIIYLASDV